MARGYAKTQLYGNVTRDIELKKTNSGKNVASFTVAVNGRNDETDFIDCVAWEKAAEILAKYVTKGKPIIIDGVLAQRNFEVDGQKRSKLEVIVRDFYFVGGGEQRQTQDVVPDDFDDQPISLENIPF